MPLYPPAGGGTPASHAASHENGGGDEIDATGLGGSGTPADVLDIPTVETDDTLVLAPDGLGGVEFRAETGGGGGGSRDGAKMFVDAAILTQLTGGGYVWDGVAYDDSSYITVFGTHSPQQVDAAAVVFAVPADGTYRVSGLIMDGGSTGGLQTNAAVRLVSQRTLSSYGYLIAQGIFGCVRGTGGNILGTAFSWEGDLDASSDLYVSFWTALAVTADKIARGSWISILRIA